MNNILISTIQFGAITSIAFFAFLGTVFAAPVLTPAAVESISEAKVTLSSMVRTPSYTTSVVWFDYWADASAPVVSTSVSHIFEVGYFSHEINTQNVRPCTTYNFRAVAMEGGVTVMSSNIGTFKTKGCPVEEQVMSTPRVVALVPSVDPVVKVSPVVKITPVVSMTTKVVVPAGTNPSATAYVKTNKNTNVNTASVEGASGVLPDTLIGWVALLISIFVALLIVLMIFESSEKRKNKHTPVVVRKDDEAEEEIVK